MTYELTYVWPNDDWTWEYIEANDYHEAMAMAFARCPATCRVKSVVSTGALSGRAPSKEWNWGQARI